MPDINSGLGWTAEQWQTVNNAVTEAFDKASVASAFLPCYGPLSASAENVRQEQVDSLTNFGSTLRITDDDTLRLFNLTVNVELSSEQVADESLSSALMTFRRAANTLAQVEDDVVFNGFDAVLNNPMQNAASQLAAASKQAGLSRLAALAGLSAAQLTYGSPMPAGSTVSPQAVERILRALRTQSVVKSSPSTPTDGLAASPNSAATFAQILAGDLVLLRANPFSLSLGGQTIPPTGEAVVQEVSKALAVLEATSNPGPFACVLGSEVFVVTHTPVPASMVLPADRITPMLGGPLLRSGSMFPTHGIVVSLASNSIDIVVATPPRVQFLQVNDDAKYLFRVYEKFVLRIKDPNLPAVYAFEVAASSSSAQPSQPVQRSPRVRKPRDRKPEE